MSEPVNLPGALVAEIRASVAPPIIIPTPAGERRIVPIIGGTVTGPRLKGDILPGGADFQLVHADGFTEVTARYAIRLADGTPVYVVNDGIRHAPPEIMTRLLRGEAVPPEKVYFRSSPRFEVAGAAYAWLRESLFVGYGERRPDHAFIRIYAL